MSSSVDRIKPPSMSSMSFGDPEMSKRYISSSVKDARTNPMISKGEKYKGAFEVTTESIVAPTRDGVHDLRNELGTHISKTRELNATTYGGLQAEIFSATQEFGRRPSQGGQYGISPGGMMGKFFEQRTAAWTDVATAATRKRRGFGATQAFGGETRNLVRKKPACLTPNP